ncbi:hypothetical protein GEW_00255, partial [Pasteurella multocida subsp. gallicida str. Anand1_poultry]
MISVENLSLFTSDHQLLLKNIQFSVQEKEWLHLKGQSGLGKSSLLRTLCGIW